MTRTRKPPFLTHVAVDQGRHYGHIRRPASYLPRHKFDRWSQMIAIEMIRECLRGRLWHCTSPERFPAILASGAIMTNPDIPDADKWTASFTREIGCVSLFDFDGFDPAAYERSYPVSNWYDFVPYRKCWGGAVWVEIDRNAIAANLISPDGLAERWDRPGARRFRIMPRIEAAHIGDLPRSAFRSAFMTWLGGDEIREINLNDASVCGFAEFFEEWKRSPAPG